MSAKNRKRISGEEAIQNILQFVEEETYTRLVNSIDSSLSEENFDPIELPTQEKTIVGIIPSQNKKKNTEVKFTNQQTKTTGRQSSRDVISNKPGLFVKSNGIENELQGFQLFFTDEILDIIVSHTKQRIDASIGDIPPDTLQNGKYPHLKPVDRIDVLSVIYVGCMV